MIKRIVDISEPAYLHLKHRQLLIDKNGALAARIPIEDLGVLILQHPAIVISQSAVIACQQNNTAIVFCDQRHLPFSVIFPLTEGNSLHAKILKEQTQISLPLRKRIWRQIVQQKILGQARTLRLLGKDAKPLEHLATKVKTGDRENHEAQAAQKYWPLLFGRTFRRDTGANGVNALLNYGYALMRAAVARAIVASGLHPAVGLHHHNQYNGLCLADDLMEPFRPWVDYEVYRMAEEQDQLKIEMESKRKLLKLLSVPVVFAGKTMPMMVSCHYLTANLKRTFQDKNVKLDYPIIQHPEDR
ncbi:MAG: type II CRISPR-associated endonuclease Cas1 [Nitrospiria bacterium]